MTPRLLSPAPARAELRPGASLLHPECPIEQTLHSVDAAVQAQLLQEIWQRHAYIDAGALLIAEPKCLRVLARTESALHAPVAALRKRHGPALVVEPPMVRYAHGAPVLEPFMTVLLNGPLRHLQLMQSDLGRRRATFTRVEHRADLFVVEAEASLGQLLGYRDWLDARFGDAVDVSIWLSRYRPIDDGRFAA